ncbi:condensation domain-containing protein [Photorhabdus temperata]|uniref:Putative polyketide synthase component n=2 Tax=Photorhabdus temperata TaxID=574560 RepID=A0A081RZ71_PHOTE|nr:beta-ketoacyl synthase N-terminal-like domain-containing protein [Photorhabdus temperata]KER03974.1 putative polyketide synthase component [Photorhabdus temperata subsp. temperata Meg1]MCT8347116.1 condensation domain-containing protein [Photorhabdus temperata]
MKLYDKDMIAVVGVSFRLPLCSTWDELERLLAQGSDCVRPFSTKRASATGISLNGNEKEGGWLEDISGFDYRYFNLSRREAELIDPRQRLTLQLAIEAIGHAGYKPDDLSGKSVGVLVAAHGGLGPDLYQLLTDRDQANPLAFIGSLHALAAGRISYLLNLHGPAQSIDTGCSSFLVALHEACKMLLTEECDVALTGGCELILGPLPQKIKGDNQGLGVESSTDRCRPFDAASDGAGFGEGGGFVLLKRLSDATRDKDIIHAVIRGSATNHDGGRSNGITAPSSQAQTQVIVSAWERANITGNDIGYIEAHGTGTKIGDPIELDGLIKAFESTPREEKPCLISSVKGNFGHLSGMAGFAGLMRIIAQFRAKTIFPTVHFNIPNPLLALTEDAPVKISDSNQPWLSAVDGIRVAGLSGFGLSGTNVHFVIQEPEITAITECSEETERLIVVSASNKACLSQYLNSLSTALMSHQYSLADIANVLMLGREHMDCRWSYVAESLGDLSDALIRKTVKVNSAVDKPKYGLIFGDICEVDSHLISERMRAFPAFSAVIHQAKSVIQGKELTLPQRYLTWLVAHYALFSSFGLTTDIILGHGIGKLAAQVANGEVDFVTALFEVKVEVSITLDPERLKKVYEENRDICFIDFSAASELSEIIRNIGMNTLSVDCSLLVVLGRIFESGIDLCWENGFGYRLPKRIELPISPFAAEACWPKTVERVKEQPAAQSEIVNNTLSVEDTLLELIRKILKEPAVTLADDFFDIGGNSLNGAQLIVRINKALGIELELMDLLESTSLEAFCDLAKAAIPFEKRVPETNKSSIDQGSLTGQQQSIWAAIELAGETGAYNVPVALFSEVEINIEWVEKQLSQIVEHQPMLRCALQQAEEEVIQVIFPAQPVKLVLQEFALTDTPLSSGMPVLIDILRAKVAEPLSPYDIPPVRFELISVKFQDGLRQILLLTFHHLFFDGWSWRLIFAALSNSRHAIPERDYISYSHYQRDMLMGVEGKALIDFWTDYLSGATVAKLPGSHYLVKGEVVALQGANIHLDISPEVVVGLKKIAKEHRVTIQMIMLTVWVALQWKITAVKDICIAMPVSNRLPEDENTIGCYVNTTIIRSEIHPQQPFLMALNKVKSASLSAISHCELPVDSIFKLVGGSAFDITMFDYHNAVLPVNYLGKEQQKVELLDIDPVGAKYPLNITCTEYGEDLQLRLEYSSALFGSEIASHWLNEFNHALERISMSGVEMDIFGLFDHTDNESEPIPDFNF